MTTHQREEGKDVQREGEVESRMGRKFEKYDVRWGVRPSSDINKQKLDPQI